MFGTVTNQLYWRLVPVVHRGRNGLLTVFWRAVA